MVQKAVLSCVPEHILHILIDLNSISKEPMFCCLAGTIKGNQLFLKIERVFENTTFILITVEF